MRHNLQHTISLLARTPATLDALLRDLPEECTMRNEGGNTFNAFDVIGHLIHGERTDWMPRAKRILEFSRPAPRPLRPPAQERDSQGKSLQNCWMNLPGSGLRSGRTSCPESHGAGLSRRGLHPELGTVTLSQLLATWAAHDLTHLHQVSRIMAHQYREAVGPWTAYLGVMQCAGHSA